MIHLLRLRRSKRPKCTGDLPNGLHFENLFGPLHAIELHTEGNATYNGGAYATMPTAYTSSAHVCVRVKFSFDEPEGSCNHVSV